MRRVWRLRNLAVPSLLALAVGALLLAGDGASAAPYQPTLSVTLSSNAPSVDADVTSIGDWGTTDPFNPNREFPTQFVTFTPAGWGMSTDADFDDGTPTGSSIAISTLGVFGISACILDITLTFSDPGPIYPPGTPHTNTGLEDASTNSAAANTINVTPGTNFAELIGDVDDGTGTYPSGVADGKMDGSQRWNSLINALGLPGNLPDGPLLLRERQAAAFLIAATGTQVYADILTYNPGVLAPASSGFATLTVTQNFNPAGGPTPAGSQISDSCGLNLTSTQFGNVGGTSHRTNPAGPVSPPNLNTKFFVMNSRSDRDADQGPSAPAEPTGTSLTGRFGFVNSDDTCPFQPNVGDPHFFVFTGDDNFNESNGGDGVDGVCDDDPFVGGNLDLDGDNYLNRGDNCPLAANGLALDNQGDVGEVGPPTGAEVGTQPVDGGAAADGIGDACDINPTVSDGHFHVVLNVEPVCIGLADADGDGWCDVEEAAFASGAGTPEALAIPTTCSDGVDNDGDGNADLADSASGPAAPSGCQRTLHDLSIKKLTGGTQACAPSNTVGYNLILNNSQTGDENGEISIYLDSQPSYVPGPGPAPAPGKSAGSVTSVNGATVTASGPINIDGDADVEWLTKATVTLKGAPSFTTTVHVNVTYPACGGGPNTQPVDYMVAVDLCHGDDIAPLGVNPLFGACAGATSSDGGQDRNSGNDGVVTRNVDDVSK